MSERSRYGHQQPQIDWIRMVPRPWFHEFNAWSWGIRPGPLPGPLEELRRGLDIKKTLNGPNRPSIFVWCWALKGTKCLFNQRNGYETAKFASRWHPVCAQTRSTSTKASLRSADISAKPEMSVGVGEDAGAMLPSRSVAFPLWGWAKNDGCQEEYQGTDSNHVCWTWSWPDFAGSTHPKSCSWVCHEKACVEDVVDRRSVVDPLVPAVLKLILKASADWCLNITKRYAVVKSYIWQIWQRGRTSTTFLLFRVVYIPFWKLRVSSRDLFTNPQSTCLMFAPFQYAQTLTFSAKEYTLLVRKTIETGMVQARFKSYLAPSAGRWLLRKCRELVMESLESLASRAGNCFIATLSLVSLKLQLPSKKVRSWGVFRRLSTGKRWKIDTSIRSTSWLEICALLWGGVQLWALWHCWCPSLSLACRFVGRSPEGAFHCGLNNRHVP